MPKFFKAFSTSLILIMTATFCGASTVSANSPELILKQPNVSLALANQLIEAALNACHAENRSAVVVIVDRAGNLIALQRDDSVGPHNTNAAQRKAYTALSTKTATRLLASNTRANPDSSNLSTINDLLLIGGGVPLKVNNDVIGAIGVGGAGGAVQDESCALQAIAKILPKI